MILPLFDYSVAGDRADRKVQQTHVYHTLSWPSLQSRREYLKCMLVYECISDSQHPHTCQMTLATHVSTIHTTHDTEITKHAPPAPSKNQKVPGLFQVQRSKNMEY